MTEILTPQAIKDRVLEFFDGVDLITEGKIKKGILTITTKYTEPLGEWEHVALVNGLDVATYTHLDPNFKQPPLEEGRSRQIEEYLLRGYKVGRGEAFASYTHYEGKSDEIRIISPPTGGRLYGACGKIEDLNLNHQKNVAEILEIKI